MTIQYNCLLRYSDRFEKSLQHEPKILVILISWHLHLQGGTVQISHCDRSMEGGSYREYLLVHKEVRGMQRIGIPFGLIFYADVEESTLHPLSVETEVLCCHYHWAQPNMFFPQEALSHSFCMGVHPFIIDYRRIWYANLLHEVHSCSTLVDSRLSLYDL